VDGGVVDESVNRVEAQCVDVEVREPPQGVVDDEVAHAITMWLVEIDGPSPGRIMCAREVRAELRQVVPVGPHMVVDDIEAHADALRVRRIDESLQGLRAAVRLVDRVERDPVVAPAPVSGKGGDGHQLEHLYSTPRQVSQPVPGDRVEGALRGERSDVNFVRDGAAGVSPLPMAIRPVEVRRIKRAGEGVDAVRLPRAARVGHGGIAVDLEGVVGTVGERGARPPAVIFLEHRRSAERAGDRSGGVRHAHDGRCSRSPHRDRDRSGHQTRSKSATGSVLSRGARAVDPPSVVVPVRTSRHRPSGSVTVCSPQPPSR